jgi:16S rRNA U1498 N3-methylase RsmE
MVALDFVPVSLGKTRLRAETASIMAASVVKNYIDHA